MDRTSFALTYKLEAKILDYLVARIPKWVTPDMLTLTALLSGFIGAFCYILVTGTPLSLLGVNVCLVVHWLTDSLDGRVARYRKTPRPNYGYYVDHLFDSISAALFVGGLAASTITETSAWMWVLALMLLVMINAFLKARVFGALQISLGIAGPTEARIGLAIVNFLILFVGIPRLSIFTVSVNLIDLMGWIATGVILIFLIPDIIKIAIKLNENDTKIGKKH
jgi:archaetidylinositol phosphate synthase